MADTRDSKSRAALAACGFNSRPRHQDLNLLNKKIPVFQRGFFLPFRMRSAVLIFKTRSYCYWSAERQRSSEGSFSLPDRGASAPPRRVVFLIAVAVLLSQTRSAFGAQASSLLRRAVFSTGSRSGSEAPKGRFPLCRFR